ncbi:BsuBI/PstI family type II restriction endonuclease [Vibrio ostreicida]|uniref:BsuBI/PstI family type II restriction endonuclease n=1 Tax=Vibrio ostreicida TaxID=526588 RepID=A0ABT8C0S0_9VIBR|nr:BsuBI/PstI family type II restriction endonuclease [Vibrio ostreicida]MDN3611840.1 BsuBI/PstI family type II restriction endonuclease [Vibrio ostreicida]NPD09652.1 restriction endonuclease [Vibrio ostreicida]
MTKADKIQFAIDVLKALGLPQAQLNERTALTLLSLARLGPDTDYELASDSMMTTRDIMDFIRDEYEVVYAANTRETIRRQSLHQMEQASLIERNRDDPKRATNSPKNNYSLNIEITRILGAGSDGDWKELVEEFNESVTLLSEQYARKREMHQIPVTLPDGKELTLSPGAHNQLHADIIHEFCPRFVGEGGRVLYIGDTASSRGKEGGKLMHLETEYLQSIGVPPMSHDKLPDVVVYDEKRKWLFLIEAVTSHGPVSPKRWQELEDALAGSPVGRVYVTAFPDRAEFRKNAADIAWETEVWIAENPEHMIHFNGDRFLGPHAQSPKN